jgi:four helix bundle protein
LLRLAAGRVAERANNVSDRTIRSFRDLDAWQAGMSLAMAAYALASRLPSTEKFELSSQVRRAAASIPSNVAEGHAQRRSRKIYLKHVRIALGSLAELDTNIELALRLRMLERADVEPLVERISQTGQLLHGIARALEREPFGPPRPPPA